MAAPTAIARATSLGAAQCTATLRENELASARAPTRTGRALRNPPMTQACRGIQRSWSPRQPLTICMAAPKRVAMVSKQLEREIGTMLLTDKVLQAAVCPERRRGLDSYLSAIASVTEVEISRDLQVAKVYVSVYSDETGKAAAFAGLKKLEGYVRKGIGRRIRLRMTPEIHFVLDDSFDRSQRVLSLLNQIKEGTNEPPPIAVPGDEEDEEVPPEDDLSELDQESGGGKASGAKNASKARSDELVNDFLGAPSAGGAFQDLYSSNKPSRGGKGMKGGRGNKARKGGR